MAQAFEVTQEPAFHAKGRKELHQSELPVVRRRPVVGCQKVQPKLASTQRKHPGVKESRARLDLGMTRHVIKSVHLISASHVLMYNLPGVARGLSMASNLKSPSTEVIFSLAQSWD